MIILGHYRVKIDLAEFSKEFLLKIVGLWEELFTVYLNRTVMVGAKIEGVGLLKLRMWYALL